MEEGGRKARRRRRGGFFCGRLEVALAWGEGLMVWLQNEVDVMGKKQRIWGFTLVEMMIVLAIISLLAAITTPSLVRMRQRETSREFANTLANQLKQLQRLSRTQGEAFLVSITPGTGGSDRGKIEVKRGLPFCRERKPVPQGNSTCETGTIPRPPTTCSELMSLQTKDLVTLETEMIKPMDLATVGEDDYLMGTSLGLNQNTVDICFSPDGRILSTKGLVLADANKWLCSGENFALYTKAATLPTELVYGAAGDEKLVNCQTDDVLQAARDEVRLYRVILPYRGAIRVAQ